VKHAEIAGLPGAFIHLAHARVGELGQREDIDGSRQQQHGSRAPDERPIPHLLRAPRGVHAWWTAQVQAASLQNHPLFVPRRLPRAASLQSYPLFVPRRLPPWPPAVALPHIQPSPFALTNSRHQRAGRRRVKKVVFLRREMLSRSNYQSPTPSAIHTLPRTPLTTKSLRPWTV
jgi:hypothetical protein